MDALQEKEIKILFDAGNLNSANVCKEPMGNGWILIFNGDRNYTIRSQRNNSSRIFKSLDATYKTLEKIGFKNFLVSYK